jgi:manganese efflux pump family protein
MGFIELFIVAIGLSMDAFAVSLCKGLNMRKLNYRYAWIISLFFGGFQAIMPIIGWALGKGFAEYITAFDHWIAFALLVIIGGKMLFEGIKKDKDESDCSCEDSLDLKELFILAIATSIDALAVGISFAFLQVSILPAAVLIGVTTFILSFAGVTIGNRFGAKFQDKAEIAGGIVLIMIGIKILLDHLGLL